MNQSIQDGLNDLFDQIIPISGDFNKKTYADSFKNAYEKYKPLFTEIAQECENSEDRQEEIEEIAAVLPDRMREVYEGYGPNGTAIIVDALTDNRNRTASNVRSAFTKGKGNIGTSGCVSFMFDQKGQIIVDKEECELDADDLMMQALDAGAEDFSEEEDSFEILTDPNDFSEVRLALEEAGIPMASAEVTMIPQTWVTLDNEEDIKNIQKTLDLLEDDDDVQEVYHNWEEA